MHLGNVKFFYPEKGWGFIRRDDNAEFFCHYSSIVGQRGYRTLVKGDRVRFDLEDNGRGICAANVEVIEQSAGSAIV